MERALALAGSDFLELDDLPPALTGGYGDVLLPALHARESMRAWGSRYARLVLERCQNNKRRACRELGISYHTLRVSRVPAGVVTTGADAGRVRRRAGRPLSARNRADDAAPLIGSDDAAPLIGSSVAIRPCATGRSVWSQLTSPC